MLAFVYSKDENELSGKVKLFHDYPPIEIKEDDMETSFKDFFSQTDRQLITVHDETH